ncbi:MAG: hypothetical protein E4H02_08575 [Lentisphaerales bacterium]|nr:MAG: hypothetical protein E4H02_08575 [Lentisphaerales bacterium]
MIRFRKIRGTSCELPAVMALVLMLAAAPFECRAERIILKILALNPADQKQTVSIHRYLPRGATADDIVSSGGLQSGYDPNSNSYYVATSVELGPHKTVRYEVILRDAWTVPESVFSDLERQAGILVGKLRGSGQRAGAVPLQSEFRQMLDDARTRQVSNTIAAAGPERHIRAYFDNEPVLRRARETITRLEDLVILTGQDPGQLTSALYLVDTSLATHPYEAGKAAIRASIRNTSKTEMRIVSPRWDLPCEIAPDDVLDADGLQVRSDTTRGITFVRGYDITIRPGQALVYDIIVRDKWNVNAPRIAELKAEATRKLAEARSWPKRLESAENSLSNALSRLATLESVSPPTEVNEAYIAFFRQQAEQLALIAAQIDRAASTSPPEEPRASRRMTWIVLCTTLLFVAVISIVLLLRWYGADKNLKRPTRV